MPQVGNIFKERYLIESLLGRGGFGNVFLARNIILPGQPHCVIKQLAPQVTDPNLIAAIEYQFYLEAVSLSRLGTHAQIPTLLDYFHSDDRAYLVIEYIPGASGAQLIDCGNRVMTEPEMENFLAQMLQVVIYLHSQQTIHRDIKPENIILCQTDRRYVLVDFGAVKDLNLGTVSQSADRAIGTPGFASPEQLANRPVYASDIYALGMTCIYLLTGKEPALFPTDPQTCEPIWADDLEISESLSAIISKMAQIALVDRYHSAQEVIDDLNQRSVRTALRAYLDRKYAIAKTEPRHVRSTYPAAIDWASRM